LAAAERLFAEHGVAAVSSRQVAEAAGQANNSAVGYHFGTKNDLVLAIVRRHAPSVERRREKMLAEAEGSSELRDWLTYLVQPLTEHLASLGKQSRYARFIAQATTDPACRQVVIDEAEASPTINVEELERLLPILPMDVREERAEMMRHLIVHVCAERERALHDGTATPRDTWEATGTGLVDALMGLWLAPYTPTKGPKRKRTRI